MAARCGRCWLHVSVRISSLVLNLFGVCLIVYSLWLQKKWNEGISQLPSASLPKPWFIYTSFGVGIATCLTTLFGYMIANCINNSSLCAYIITICFILFLEVAVIVTILFSESWTSVVDKDHKTFETFVKFQLIMLRFITVIVLVPQIVVLCLSCVLWIIGDGRMITRHRNSELPDFWASFLVLSPSRLVLLDQSREICWGCERLGALGEGRQNLFTFAHNMFQRRTSTI